MNKAGRGRQTDRRTEGLCRDRADYHAAVRWTMRI